MKLLCLFKISYKINQIFSSLNCLKTQNVAHKTELVKSYEQCPTGSPEAGFSFQMHVQKSVAPPEKPRGLKPSSGLAG